jgi:hypothetical protein
MWQQAAVDRALEVMTATGLNALVFHQNDLLDWLVLPSRYFSDDLMWKRWPVRLHQVMNNRQYVRKVAREAAERGIAFYPEVKELWCTEPLLELKPELRNADGALCPTHPFWWELLETKVRELLQTIPEIGGIIVSPGTRESKVSMSANACRCDRCARASKVDWYTELLVAMHRPLAAQGKRLVVRDFSYTADQQSLIIEAATRCAPDVVISLKNTPHDYYPPFPTNPRIGHCGGQPQHAEFDTWGQFFGLGFFPASVAEDMQRRMQECLAKGVTGIQLRTDWEGLTEASAFNSFNLLNVFAGGLLSQDVDADLAEAYRAWARYGLLSPLKAESSRETPVSPTAPDAAARLMAFMRASWAVIEKALFVRGHLFHEDDMFPETVKKAFAMMVDIHGRDEWEPGASRLVQPTPENLEVVFAEKAAALREVAALPAILQVESLGLPPTFADEVGTILDLYGLYVRGFSHCAQVCFRTRSAAASRQPEDIRAARESVEAIRAYRDGMVARLGGTHYPHYVYWLFDHERLDQLAEDALRLLAEATPSETRA